MKCLIFQIYLLLFFVFTAQTQNVNLILPLGHQAGIHAIAVDPARKHLLTGSDDKTIKLWDIATAKETRTYYSHKGKVNAIEFISETLFLSASSDSTIKLWETGSDVALYTYAGHTGSVNAIAVSDDHKQFISVASDSSVIIWDLNKKEILKRIKLNSRISAVSYANNNKWFVIGDEKGKIEVFNKNNYKKLFSIQGHQWRITSLNAYNNFVVSASWDGFIKVWETDKMKMILSISDSHSGINQASIIKEGSQIISCSMEGEIKTWNFHDGALIKNINVHASSVYKLLAYKDDNFFSCSEDNTAKLWSLNEGVPLKEFRGFCSRITSVKFAPDNKHFLSSHEDTLLKFWDLECVSLKKIFSGHKSIIYAVDFSGDGKQIISASADKTIKLWNIDKDSALNTYCGHTNIVRCVKFYPDNIHFLSSSWDGSVKLWNINDAHPVRSFNNHKAAVYSVHPVGSTSKIASGAEDMQVMVNDTSDISILYSNSTHTDYVRSVDVSSDGRYIFSGSWDGTIVKWDIISGVKNIFKDSCKIYAISLLSDDKTLAVGYECDKIKLWDTEKGIVIRNFIGHTDKIYSVDVSTDSKFLLSGSYDNSIKLWNLNTGEEIVTIIPIVNNEWIIVSTDKYYKCSKNLTDKIGFKINSKVYGFDQFDLKYNRPDIVLQRIGLASDTLIHDYYLAYQKRLEKMGIKEEWLKEDFHVPDLTVLNEDALNSITTTAKSKIDLHIKATDDKYPILRLNVWVNDVNIFGMRGKQYTDSISNIDTTLSLPLSLGKNKIQVSVLGKNGGESLKNTYNITYEPKVTQKPDLYIVGIGVKDYKNADGQIFKNLMYAEKDISEIIDTLKKGEGKYYNKAHCMSFLGKQAIKDSLQNVKSFLKNSKVDDVVIVYCSGHGKQSSDNNFYFGTYDFDMSAPQLRGLAYDTIESWLDGIPARQKLLLIDACQSGEGDKDTLSIPMKPVPKKIIKKETQPIDTLATASKGPESYNVSSYFELSKILFADLRRGTGATVISAAGATASALEGQSNIKNGYFTYSFLQALKDPKADKNKDGYICVSELQEYMQNTVETISGGLQKPTSRLENLSNDFRVWQK